MIRVWQPLASREAFDWLGITPLSASLYSWKPRALSRRLRQLGELDVGCCRLKKPKFAPPVVSSSQRALPEAATINGGMTPQPMSSFATGSGGATVCHDRSVSAFVPRVKGVSRHHSESSRVPVLRHERRALLLGVGVRHTDGSSQTGDIMKESKVRSRHKEQ